MRALSLGSARLLTVSAHQQGYHTPDRTGYLTSNHSRSLAGLLTNAGGQAQGVRLCYGGVMGPASFSISFQGGWVWGGRPERVTPIPYPADAPNPAPWLLLLWPMHSVSERSHVRLGRHVHVLSGSAPKACAEDGHGALFGKHQAHPTASATLLAAAALACFSPAAAVAKARSANGPRT